MKMKALFVSLIVLAIYLISGRGVHTQHHFFVPLAQSFLNGKLYVPTMEFALHEMVSEKEIVTGISEEPVDGVSGKYYVIYPPLPAVILMPFVAMWGSNTNQSVVSAIVAALSVYVAIFVFAELKIGKKALWWMTALYACGSMLWYHATVGSAWYFAHAVALLFLWLAILMSLRQRIWWIGIMIGLAYLARFPVILSLPFFLYRHRKEWWKIMVGVGVAVLVSFVYNYLRYGTVGNYGYWLLEHRWYNLANEYARGSYDLSYLPRHLHALVTSLPDKIPSWPYYAPDMTSMALWIVFPAVFILLRAPWKNKMVVASVLAIVATLPASLLHGGVGASQFGYRYALDYMPFLLLIVVQTLKDKWQWWYAALIILSVIVNAWGVYFAFWQ